MINTKVPIFNFRVENASDNEVDIYIDGQIVDAGTQTFYEYFGDDTTTSFKSFRETVNKTDVPTYNVYVNSPGGMVTEAMAIHDLLRDLQNKGKTVNTIGRGIIASAATYILMAGKKATMSKNAWFMIHNVSGFAWGDVNEVEQMASMLRKFNNRIRDFYAEETGLRKEDISKMMDAETWMTADEAKTKNFIKVVEGDSEIKNAIPQENWLFKNMAVLNAYNNSIKPAPAADPNKSITENFEQMKKFWNDLATKILNSIKEIKKPENNDHASLMSSIGEAVSNSLNAAADEMENAVNDVVNKAITTLDVTSTDAFKNAVNTGIANAVKTAVDAAVLDMNNKISNLEKENGDLKKKNEDLEKDILNIKGKPSNSGAGGGEEPKPIGGWKK